MALNKFISGTAIRIYCECVDKDGILLTPGSYIKITIFAPDESKKVDAVAMTAESTGKLLYTWQTADTDQKGIYTVMLEGEDATPGGNKGLIFERLIELCGEVTGSYGLSSIY